jgi:hypothetical protein
VQMFNIGGNETRTRLFQGFAIGILLYALNSSHQHHISSSWNPTHCREAFGISTIK